MPLYVNVDGAQKVLSDVYANIDGAQRHVTTMYANIDGAQKNLMGYKWAKYYPHHVQTSSTSTSLHLYSGNGQFYNADDFVFDANTGYYTTYKSIDENKTFKNISSPTTSNYYFVGYGQSTDGKVAYQNTRKGIMAYTVYRGARVTLDSNSHGATFVNSNNPSVIYTSTISTTQHGDFIEYVTSNDETAYPDNGVQDGYWYIRQ